MTSANPAIHPAGPRPGIASGFGNGGGPARRGAGRSAGRSPWRRIVLATLAVLASLALVAAFLRRTSDDGTGRYPHPFLAVAGYEAAALVFVPAPIERPPPAPAGLAGAWRCDDPAFADAHGRPWLFPMAETIARQPLPPIHPRLQRRPALAQCRPYQSPDAQLLLHAYRERAANR
jgi:hypothetical protein